MSDITISVSLNEARLTATRDYLDAGTGNAVLQIWDGSRPANGGATTGCNKLAEIDLNKPCGAVASNQLALSFEAETLALTSGVATWARFLTAAGSHAIDSDVSDLAGTALVRLNSTTLYEGGKVVVASAYLG